MNGQSYSIRTSEDYTTVVLEGTLRLQGREQYGTVNDTLMQAAEKSAGTLVIDMRGLTFLNSSGISTLSLFIIEMRRRRRPVRILGTKDVAWQARSLHNLQRLYEGVDIQIS